ncbi:hypothetical protein FA95DRAFT_1498290 [Auriscalpium vulgare]|uniref:Uncharacterized protein n=1 Tax=Auriscalpium vulgare TaxID=40419 RepID=A0ACB8RIB8_9AGAM|nr:hypothetical protein FA95DRAFT_1498290 [Auriscalpium vulgare]
MSEYWVSKKKYFCKYCDIYIADDAPSRQHHENGMRHKGNVDRFVRGLYKAGEKKKKDDAEEKREMVRIEQAANAAFAQDVGAGRAKGSSPAVASTSAASSSGKKPAPKSRGGFADYSTAASLGFTDPDEERALAEAAVRQTQGVAGEWHYVSTIPAARPASSTPEVEPAGEDGSRKRPAEPADEEDERGWKLRKKTVSVGLGEVYDPGLIPIKIKPKKEVKEEVKEEAAAAAPLILGADASALGVGVVDTTPLPTASALPKWTSVKWKKGGADGADGSASRTASGEVSTPEPPAGADTRAAGEGTPDPKGTSEALKDATAVKEEPEPVKLEPSDVQAVPTSDSPSGGSLFRKRRAPVAGAAGRGRRT